MKGNNKKMGDFIPPYCHSYIVVANEDQGIENSFPFYVQRRNCGNFQAQYIYIYLHIHIYIICICLCLWMYVCMYVCMYACMYVDNGISYRNHCSFCVYPGIYIRILETKTQK